MVNLLSPNPKRNLNELYKRGESFFKNLGPSDKIALIYHRDMDGVCSAALIRLGLKRISDETGTKIEISKNIVTTYKDMEVILKTLNTFNKIIIVDIGFNHHIGTDKDVLLIDHHLIETDLNNESFVFINPRFENEEIYQPASYVVYKLLSRFVDLKDVEWVSAIGIISDWGYEDCKDVLDNWVKVKDKDELFGTKIGQIGDLLLGASYILGFDEILHVLTSFKSIQELKGEKKIVDAYKKYDLAFKDSKKQFWDNAETFGNVIFSIIKPEYRGLSSPIINRVSFENPDKVVFLFEEIDEEYKISARYQYAGRQNNVHLGRLMKKCCSGGGHMPAAGGSVKTGDIEKFKQCVLKELN